MTKEIHLTQNKVALVDDADYEWLNQWKWLAHFDRHNWYAERFEGRTQIKMHRLITSAPKGMEVDHVNGNGLDNRRVNLRVCTHAQNNQNRKRVKNPTGFRGVQRTRDGKYAVQICLNWKRQYLGTYPNPEDAARAYDKKARELFGEFANLNFPE